MRDESVLGRIDELVDEEHRLRSQLAAGVISSAEEQARLRTVAEQLDQCWDLLRRRRAARSEGQPDDVVEPRPVEEVERYLQ
ncbi:DUF2630 family protein [Natronosporangium hydrolyticum]|uniref:DUF2630 family protein n=1 Tax=Natronosporangium hydrolyticum TaxID=2811111 RepID=A0A895YF43_9ACTN|nr:DUF2630 family protein [Natronosporangium hydrolyticum]QSB14049.1 DUF2630 family protein [Natronosporangium hydrolyticum]